MAKTITLQYKDKEYTLEFNRASVKALEEGGFSFIDAIEKKKMFALVDNLFRGSFIMHHPYISPAFVDEIYEAIGDKEGLLQRLMEMYTDTMNTLSEQGNIEWKATW